MLQNNAQKCENMKKYKKYKMYFVFLNFLYVFKDNTKSGKTLKEKKYNIVAVS